MSRRSVGAVSWIELPVAEGTTGATVRDPEPLDGAAAEGSGTDSP